MAKIDVLMPVRDVGPWVGEAYRSLARQTFKDFTLIAVDDGSVDDTMLKLVEAAAGDRRLKLLSIDRSSISKALNHGLAHCDAPYVVRMDGDDMCHPERLELLVDHLDRQPKHGVIGSRVVMFPKRLVPDAMRSFLYWQNSLLDPAAIKRERYVETTLTHASCMFRRELLEEVGGWWDGHGPEDLDLFLKLHSSGVAMAKLDRALYFWREREDRETRGSDRCSLENFRKVKADHLICDLEVGGVRRVELLGRGASLEVWATLLRERSLVASVSEYDFSMKLQPGIFRLYVFGNPKPRERVRQFQTNLTEELDYLFIG